MNRQELKALSDTIDIIRDAEETVKADHCVKSISDVFAFAMALLEFIRDEEKGIIDDVEAAGKKRLDPFADPVIARMVKEDRAALNKFPNEKVGAK